MKYLSVVLLVVFLITQAQGNVAEILCPKSDSLIYRSTSAGSVIIGFSDVINHIIPNFKLSGFSNIISTDHFLGAQFLSYGVDGNSTFTCYYSGKNANGTGADFNLKAVNTPWVKWCHINQNQNTVCYGQRSDCVLKCQIL